MAHGIEEPDHFMQTGEAASEISATPQAPLSGSLPYFDLLRETLGENARRAVERREPNGLSVPLSRKILDARIKAGELKMFYAMMRALREAGRGEILDIGSSLETTQEERARMQEVLERAIRESFEKGDFHAYPSSWGLPELRHSIADLFERRAGVKLDFASDIMVTGGIMRSVESLIRALDVELIIVPSLSPWYIYDFARLHGKKMIFVDLDKETGCFDMEKLGVVLHALEVDRRKILFYMTLPSAPAGTLPPDEFMENEFIPFLKSANVRVVSDSYIFATSFGDRPVRPFMSYRGAREVGVEAITTAKELGLPGIRIGGLVGNREMINAVRLFATTDMDMLPLPMQRAAAMALREIDPSWVAQNIRRELFHEILPAFQDLHWPVTPPHAGLDFLIPIPAKVSSLSHAEDRSFLAAIVLLIKYGVGFCPVVQCAPEERHKWLRMVLKQDGKKIPRALRRMQEAGFDWRTFQPDPRILSEMSSFMENMDLTNL